MRSLVLKRGRGSGEKPTYARGSYPLHEGEVWVLPLSIDMRLNKMKLIYEI